MFSQRKAGSILALTFSEGFDITDTSKFDFNLPSVGGDADAWGTKLNTNWTNLDTLLNGGTAGSPAATVKLKDLEVTGKVTEEVHAAGTSGTIDIDPANGTVQTIAMGGNITVTASNFADGQFVSLKITSVGSDSVTWPTMQWAYGSAPSLHATNTNWVQLWKCDGVIYGSFVGPFS